MVTMYDILALLLTCLATARVTRLITEDRIFQAPRRWLLMRMGEERLSSYLLVCPWCMSLYVGAGAAGAWYAWGDQRWFLAVCAVFAFSYVAGFLAGREGE